MRAFALALMLPAALAVAGCGKSKGVDVKPGAKPMANNFPVGKAGGASLAGKITHGGKPIVAGKLLFFAGDGLIPVVGRIEQNGDYAAIGLPEGDLNVCVLLDPEGELPFPVLGGANMPGPGGPPMMGGGPPMAGGPPMMPMPPMPPGMPKPPGADGPTAVEGQFDAGLPEGLPPPVFAQMKAYTVPPDLKATYGSLHRKYSAPGKTNPLKVTIAAGENKKDIVVP